MTSAQKQGVILWRVQHVGGRWTFALLHPDKKHYSTYHESFRKKSEVAEAVKRYSEKNEGIYHELTPEQFGLEISYRKQAEESLYTFYAFTKMPNGAFAGFALLPNANKIVEFWRSKYQKFPNQEKIMGWVNNGDIHILPDAVLKEVDWGTLLKEESNRRFRGE